MCDAQGKLLQMWLPLLIVRAAAYTVVEAFAWTACTNVSVACCCMPTREQPLDCHCCCNCHCDCFCQLRRTPYQKDVALLDCNMGQLLHGPDINLQQCSQSQFTPNPAAKKLIHLLLCTSCLSECYCLLRFAGNRL